MATVRVSIVHDEVGNVVSVTRPAEGASIVPLGGDGQSVLETEIDDNAIEGLASGKQRVDTVNKEIVDNNP
ncbi:hypothetical protein [Streptomyces iakyrus]|uniref:hypothetical protein n=1 Tax=Streptomyces iakyrus TaxID=68219 RepID=UPI0036F5965B